MSPYSLVIRGKFVINGRRPNANTIRFIPDNDKLLANLHRAYRIRPSRMDNSIKVRLDGIDAPVTHYGDMSQPYGLDARNTMLQSLGFDMSAIDWENDKVTVRGYRGRETRGALLTSAVDCIGRPVGYVLPEDKATGLKDGVWTEVASVLSNTSNLTMLKTGSAYFAPYTSMPLNQKRAMLEIVRSTRTHGVGVWKLDSTEEFRFVDQSSIGPTGALIMPKLFRRCTDYLVSVSRGFDGTLVDWLWANNGPNRLEDDRIVVEDRFETNLSQILEHRNNRIAFKVDPNEITFVEK